MIFQLSYRKALHLLLDYSIEKAGDRVVGGLGLIVAIEEERVVVPPGVLGSIVNDAAI